jgi:hypothetical protein
MFEAFWSGLGGEFARQWMVRILTPAFAFWAGGLSAIWWHQYHTGVRRHGLQYEISATATWLYRLPGLAQGLILVGGLLLVAVSAVAVGRLTLPLLRLLEGYWSHPRWPRNRLVASRRRRYSRWRDRVDALNLRQRFGSLTTQEFLELNSLEKEPARDTVRLQELRRRRTEGFDAQMVAELGRGRRFLRNVPEEDALGMPTRLGDILRAAEERPNRKYGLDTIVCWYALWLVLPTETKTEIVQARGALDRAAVTWLWGAFFLVWTPWTWWAIPVAVAVPVLAYYVGILGAARLFSELTVSAFDLYRFRLYDSLHLPRPSSPALERRHDGPRVNNLLWGGLDEPGLDFVNPSRTSNASE